jgi:hypothetical protein
MAAPTYQLGSINLNNQTTYSVDKQGVNLGAKQRYYEDAPSYSGGVVQVNVRDNGYSPMTIPLWVQGASVADLESLIDAIRTETAKSTNTLTVEGVTFGVGVCNDPDYERDQQYYQQFRAYVTLTLSRTS